MWSHKCSRASQTRKISSSWAIFVEEINLQWTGILIYFFIPYTKPLLVCISHRRRTHTAEPSDSSYWWENLVGWVVQVSRESLQVNRCRCFWGGRREIGGTISQHRLGVWGVRLSKCLSDGSIFSGKQETRSLLRVQDDAECADNLFMCSVIEKSLSMSLCGGQFCWRHLSPSIRHLKKNLYDLYNDDCG